MKRKRERRRMSKSPGKSRPEAARRPKLQVLEERCVLSITPPVLLAAQSTLVITGGSLDDTVVVSESPDDASIIVQQYELGVRLTTTYPKSSITSLQFFGNDGNDRLTNRTDIATYAEGGEGNDSLTGGRGSDTLSGGNGNDRLEGGLGNDTLDGGNDEDVLHGEEGADRLNGGDGKDLLYGGEGSDRLYGDAGDDQLEGSTGEDYLNGGTGNDRLSGGSGDDFLNGADGADRLLGQQGDDILLGGDGDDVLLGEAGNDNLHGGEGDDYLYGADGNDRLYGNAGVDRLDGDGGDDYLNGGSGNDLLDGGADKDFLNGADGDDRLIGGDDADAMLGGAGIDTLFGGEGADRLDGGADDDFLYGGEGPDLLYGRSGADRLEGEAGDDYLNGGSDNDAILGGIGNDFLAGDTGEDRLEGNDGDDTLHGGDGPDVLLGDEGDDHLEGGSGDDVLHGAGGADIARGGSGNDWMDGGSGNDALYGDSGDDYLQGGSDADYLFGDSGDDRLSGQGGDDTLLAGDGNDVLLGDDGDDHLEGGNGDDYLYGNEGNDFANGDAGHDTVYGEAGNDFLRGGEGDDLLVGGAGNDHLLGDDGSDRLEGDDGADALLGGDGDDSLVAGLGNDIAIGGGGVDTVLGSEGDDILIGGTTAYDADPAALSEALAQWNAGQAYEERVDALSSHTAAAKFVPHMTVHADLASDLLEGSSGQDWFVLSAINGVYSPLGMSHGADGPASHHGSTIFLDEKPALEGFALIDSIDRLNDSLASEAVHTALPHGDNASKLGEHLRLFQLVRYADVTHTAIGSGNWSDPSVWENGRVPTENSRVLIPHGAAVVVDSRLEDDLHSIRVDGLLSFATDSDTELRVDTVVVTTTGSLQMGTAEAPVQQGVSAKLLITDTGPIDRVADPFGLGRGLITHGTVRMHGAATTSFVAMTGAVQAGATTLRLASVPIGWNVGDKIAIAGTTVGGEQDETRVIRAISGDTVTFDPLDYDHAPFEPGLEVHVANLSRNVMVESETTSDIRRGHVMFMHNRDVHISYAAFNELGRTDKEFSLTDPEVDENWNLIGESGDNPRARYSVHFHRNGVQANSAPATVHGSVVDGGPGWGFVNHSSYVDFTENVAFGVDGAAFVAEAGDEIGRFDSNLALHTTGTAGDLDSRFNQQDFGFSGEGFWLQSPGVTVTNNVVAGSAGSAFIYYSRGLGHGESQVQFLAENLDDPSIAGGDETISVIATPITKFEGNVAYASQVGLTSRYNLRNAEHSVQSVYSDSTFWNNQVGIDLPYANQTVLRDLTVLADPAAGLVSGIDHNALTRNITYENLRVEGYQRAILLPRQGTNVVDGGQFKSFNASLVVYPADVSGLQVLIKGDPIFASLGDSIAKDVTMKFQTDNASNNPRHVFRDIEVRLQYGVFSDHRLYFREQEASAIPFPEPLAGIPDSYVGLTQAQLSAQFDVRVGGEIAPDLAVPVPTLHGLVAPISLSALRQA